MKQKAKVPNSNSFADLLILIIYIYIYIYINLWRIKNYIYTSKMCTYHCYILIFCLQRFSPAELGNK